MDFSQAYFETHSDAKTVERYTVKDVLAFPENRRVQLINGRLYDMATPTTTHQDILLGLCYDIRHYIKNNNGKCRVYPAPLAVYLDENDDNYFEPDIFVVCDPTKMTERGCKGAPDLIIEIVSKSTQALDYMKKFVKYKDMGVKEYWIVDPSQQRTGVYLFERYDEINVYGGTKEEGIVSFYGFDEPISFHLYPKLSVVIADYLE